MMNKSVCEAAGAYTKRFHTRHKPLDFINSCKALPSDQAMETCDAFKKRRRRRRRKKGNREIVANVLDSKSNHDSVPNDESAGSLRLTETVEFSIQCQDLSDVVNNGKGCSKAVIFSIEEIEENSREIVSNQVVANRGNVEGCVKKTDVKFGSNYTNRIVSDVIDLDPSFGTNNKVVLFDNITKNRCTRKGNVVVSCFSNQNDVVLRGYGERLCEAKQTAMSKEEEDHSVPEDVYLNKDTVFVEANIQKTPQFWPGPKRRSKRNKNGNVYNSRKASKVKNERRNSEISWLDVGSQDDYENESYGCDAGDKILPGCDVNEQLSSYKSRFSSSFDDNIEWNNMKSGVSAGISRIGLNVNNLNGVKNTVRDTTKRSRRKAEPFDFEVQSDCNVDDLLEQSTSGEEYGLTENRRHALDIPGNLCSFMTDSLEGKSVDNITRSLFSGSISDKGLYIPSSSETVEKGDFSSKRNSFQKIFEKDYELDNSDSGSVSDSSSDDDEVFDSAGDDTDERGEGVLLPPEPQLGNVEYKLKLVNPTKQRFEHLVTQMKWRLREGRGEAVYGIGVRDCGRVRGLGSGRMRASLRTLRRMSDRLGAQCSLLAVVRTGGGGRYGAEVLVRRVPDDQHNIELRVAVMGSNDAGKSTLVGVLTQGELDNGRGSARLNMFRHLHEVRTGRTSSVSHEILGFDSQGRPINYAYGDLTTPEEIVERSSKLVSFIDLAGHRKYLKTTVQGLTGYSPHLAMLVISATGGVNQMTMEHLALAIALQLPLLIVSTRADCGTVPEEAIADMLTRANSRKIPHLIRTMEDCTVSAVSVWDLRTVPIFSVSSVTGQGLDLLRWFLYRLPPPPQCNNATRDLDQEAVEFQIDEVFRVGDRGGPVVAGLLKTGVITERNKLLIGPLDNGNFVACIVESIRRNRAACRAVRAGQAASLRLGCSGPHLRQGMVLLSIPDKYPHSLDINQYEDQYITSIKNNNTQVCKEKILSESSHLWNSEKVSPKATKKMKRRRKKFSANGTRKDDTHAINLNRIKEDSSTDTYDELEHNCDDERYASSSYRDVNTFGRYHEKSAIDYDKGIADRIKDLNGDMNRLSILDLKLDEDLKNLVKHFPVDDGVANCVPNRDGLVDGDTDPRGCFFFQAQIKLLHNSSDIYPGFQSTVHVGSIRQTAVIEAILSHESDATCVRAGCRAQVLFRFVRHPEYLRVSCALLFREGLHTKGVGQVTHVYHHHITMAPIE